MLHTNRFSFSHTALLSWSISIFLGIFFSFGVYVSETSAAALCVTNPERGLCPVNIGVSASPSSVPFGGSSNITLEAFNIFQYEVYLTDFAAWMVEDGTGITTNLYYTAGVYAITRNVNTGPLTRSVTVYFFAENTQAVSNLVSTRINVAAPVITTCDWPGGSYSWGASCSAYIAPISRNVGENTPTYTYNAAGYSGDITFVCNPGNPPAWGISSQSCVPTPVNCSGSWSNNGTCSVVGACGQTGVYQQTFTQTTAASGGGSSCTALYGAENGGTRWGASSCSTAACAQPNCSATTISNCNVSNTPYTGTSGSCTSGYTGSCSYTCTAGGVWGGPSSNSCTPSGPVAPTLSLSASPTVVPSGSPSTLTWTVGGTADSCWASGGWTGWKAFSGTNNETVNPITTTTYTLECWNAGVSSGPQSETVTIGVANVPPLANAGIDRTIFLPTNTSSASGASASDPDGSVISTIWSKVSGPAGGSITNGSTLTPNFNAMNIAGTYVFRLTVTDNQGGTNTDDVSVFVNNTPQCADGVDNADPEDILIDMADPGCSSASDNDETDTATPPVITVDSKTNSTVFINPGDTVTIGWDTNNGDETSCTLTTSTNPDNIGNTVIFLPGGGNAEMGTILSGQIYVKTRFTITCAGLSDTTTVEPVSGPIET